MTGLPSSLGSLFFHRRHVKSQMCGLKALRYRVNTTYNLCIVEALLRDLQFGAKVAVVNGNPLPAASSRLWRSRLAIVGIYGLLPYSVAESRQESGIRMAQGAERADIVRLVVRQGLLLATCGIGIGLITALLLTRLIASA